ncbi:DNA type IV secretion system protein ComB10 [Helicobacter suis]|uniref:VirB10 type IV secretion protein n=1 Tax=Helicobacter suis TaxID=104628 RepID=A0A6J4CVY0_9HELI|nr:DNA type IV secretion system protein ComB10 [Helicobacter suis]BCD48845.1 VirB10 type IV secretion protein [Helicobacter suis]BCD50625.1 VirB10 type IV secretion protein [Helicobacter suis]BCD69649.1 VirB10 type IV secretion protein [Helicobacter suis]GFK16129.1 VirB10 type IV secretion protein [Helicobacter suis]
MDANTKKWLKRGGIVLGGALGLFVLAMVVDKNTGKSKEEILELEESTYPLSDYFFVNGKKKDQPQSLPQIETHQHNTKKDYNTINKELEAQNKALEKALESAKQEAKKLPQVVVLKNTETPKSIGSVATPQPVAPIVPPRTRRLTKEQLELLNSRMSPFEPLKDAPKAEIDYGVDSFENLKAQDKGTNENKLLRTITADKMIPAFLITPISSQIAGKVTAQVETDIFANMGRAVLIPKGSKVIGYYNNNNKIGEYRLNIAWTRIITPQGINIMLTNARGVDVKGYNGLIGKVIARNFSKYGMPLLTSTLSNGLLIALTSALANRQNKAGVGNPFFGDYLLMQLTRNTGMSLNQIVGQILADKARINPIIIIREGSRVFISPNLDIFIPKPRHGEVLAQFFKEKKPVVKSQEESYEENEF